MAAYPVGTALALHQVSVYHKNGGWEVAATEATQIEECPQELRQDLLDAWMPSVDYNVVKATPATLSGLASVILPQNPRELEGVFEVHSVAVLGVSSVLNDGAFQMRSCTKCKAIVHTDLDRCEQCTDFEGFEQRWILSLDLADQKGGCSAMLYHDTAAGIPFLDGDGADDANKLKINSAFRAKPWSIRVVYKKNEMKRTNYLEIKRMEPTLTTEGVVASFRLLPTPHVPNQDACPFALCASVSYDNDLGVLTVDEVGVKAVRLLVKVLAPGETEVCATPDPTNSGFRVCRKVTCALAPDESDKTYEIKIAGISSRVQWLMTAAADACYLITAQGRGADKAFTVIAHEDTKAIGEKQYVLLMDGHIHHKGDVAVAHASTDTPQKRLQSLNDAVPAAETPQSFNKRRRLD